MTTLGRTLHSSTLRVVTARILKLRLPSRKTAVHPTLPMPKKKVQPPRPKTPPPPPAPTSKPKSVPIPVPVIPPPPEPWFDLSGKRVIVVGNGPSAPQNAELIDSFDVVVRVQGFPFDGRVGHKWDIWFASFSGACLPIVQGFHLLTVRLPDVVINCSRRNPIPYEPREVYRYADQRALAKHLGVFIPEKSPPPPSTGFQAIDAILMAHPAVLAVVGFDATTNDNKTTWKHWWADMEDTSKGGWEPDINTYPHRFDLETKAREEWMKTRCFCGVRYPDTEPIWIRLKEKT